VHAETTPATGGGAPERAASRSRRLHEARGGSTAGNRYSLLRTLVTLVVTVAVVAAVRTLIIQGFTIPSGSMEDTLNEGDRVLVTMYDADSVERGDVVVFTDPDGWLTDPEPTGIARVWRDALVLARILPQNAGHHLIKRVIGLPGDHITADGTGPVRVNGVVLDEPYLKPGRVGSEIAFDVTVPEGYVWVMGDNRSNSADSRLHQGDAHGGFVPADDVVGIARCVVWPLGSLSGLSGGKEAFSDVPEPTSTPTVAPTPAITGG
jgi:signal peptidase I